MRTHIAKSINTRCKAIKNAVKTYNKLALEVDPPRPPLDWTKASHYNFLEDFELFKDTRQDITSKPWGEPVVRVAMKQSQRIHRAREEIENCNVEVRRLHTHIFDENTDLRDMVAYLRAQNDPIAGAVDDFSTRRRRVNAQLLYRIYQLYELNGFTGDTRPGQRVGRRKRSSQDESHGEGLDEVGRGDDSGDDEEQDGDESEEMRHQYGGLINYISDMTPSN